MKYPCVLQVDVTDCAAACLSTILLCYGKKVSISTIRKYAFTDQNGTNGIGLIEAAEKLKLSAKAYRVDDPKEFIRKGSFPCIAHVIMRGFNHYVVIYEFSLERVLVGDPAAGVTEYSLEEFAKYWTGVIFTVTPTKDFKGMKGEQSRLWKAAKLLFSEKSLLIRIVLMSVLFTVLGFSSSVFFKLLFDYLIPRADMPYVVCIAAGFAAVTLVQRAIHYLRVNMLVRLERNFDRKITLETIKRILKMPLGFFASRQSGELIARLNDSYKIREALSGSSISAFVDSVMVILGGAALCYLSFRLFLVTVIMVCLYVLFTMLYKDRIKSANRKMIESNAKVNADYVEMIKGIETVKSLGAESSLDTRMTEKFASFLGEVSELEKTHNRLGFLTNTTQAIGYIIILSFGAHMIMNGDMTSGDLLAFYSMLGFFVSPILRIVDMQISLQGALIAFDRIEDIRNNDVEKLTDGMVPDTPIELIEMENVSFSYGVRERILKNVSLKIRKGDRVAIIGESGSGKTTLAKLLMSFYDAGSGRILINGMDISSLKKSWIRSKIVYVSQDPYFFNGSVRDNLLFGIEEGTVSDETIMNVARRFSADGFISDMPDGLDSHIQEGASNISGGQKQRLALVRAFLRDPEVLILDEATSHLDTITEQSIADAVNGIDSDKTVIVIAHRLSTINNCSKVIALKEGRIIEQGDRETLLQTDGYYSEVMQRQIC